MDKIRISGIVNESIVDGPGIRLVVFSQGCPHKCIGCHNPQTHDFSSGKLICIEEIIDKVKSDPILSGVTFSGGEPFEQAEPFTKLAVQIHKLGLNVVTYTGYTLGYLIEENNKAKIALLRETDILIDGPFIESKKNLLLKFRGSENQNIYDKEELNKYLGEKL